MKGVQTTITLFLVIMAVLMIPCSKLSDRWGRKRCFTVGLILYGIGTVLSASPRAWACSSSATPCSRALARLS